METETYVFHLGPYDVPALMPQLSRALETRMEMRLRETYPVMWNYIDRLRAIGGGRVRSRGLRTALSIILLLAGVFLFVPGCMSPETLRVPLVAGALGIIFGVLGLRRASGKQKLGGRFVRAARVLLDGKERISEEQGICVAFSAEGMTVSANGQERSNVPYDNIESIVEAENLYLVVYDRSAIALQKRDLRDAQPAEFSEFLLAHKKAYYRVN